MRQTKKPPKYGYHKTSGRARVIWKGHHIWLGQYGSPESKQKYARIVAAIASDGRPPDDCLPMAASVLTIDELSMAYKAWAAGHYQDDGIPTKRYMTIDRVATLLCKLYGDLPATAFGPRELTAFRTSLIIRESDGTPRNRHTINDFVLITVGMYRWAAEHGQVSADVWQALTAVSPLKAGRSNAAEPKRIEPADIADVAATCALLPRTLSTLVWVQLWTGMRSGEAVSMRVGDIDRSGPVWIYRPAKHKTQHKGKMREIAIPECAQELLQHYVDAAKLDGNEYLFSPERAQRERGRQRVRKGSLRTKYASDVYGKAITRAAKEAGVPHWHPHQLRHTYATAAKSEAGWEAARVLLGHSSAATTEIYVEEDRRIAMMSADKVAERLVSREGV